MVGSSWFATPNFPVRSDGTRYPAFNAGYDTFSFRFFDITYREMARDDLMHGDIPLWNSNSWLGVPLAAQYQNQVFSPLEWLDWLGNSRWWNFTLIVRIALAGFGTFLFSRRLTGNEEIARGAALIYVVSAYFVGFQSVSAFVNSAMLLPWIFFAVDQAWHGRSTLNSVALVGATFGLAMVSGQPQLALLNFAGAALFATVGLLTASSFRQRVGGVLVLTAGSILALALAAPQIAAFAEGLQHGYTIHPPGAYSGGSTSPLNLLLPFSPMLLGPLMSPWLPRLYPAELNHEAFPVLLGAALTIAVTVGTFTVLRPRAADTVRYRWSTRCLLILVGLIVSIITAGSLGWANFWSFPIANQINLPRYSAPLIALAVAVIGAIGIERAKEFPRWTLGVALATAAIAVLSLTYAARFALQAPLAETNVPLRSLSLTTAALSTVGSWVIAVYLLLFRAQKINGGSTTAIVILVVAELSLQVRYGLDLGSERWRLLAWATAALAAVAWAHGRRRVAWLAVTASGMVLFVLALTAPRFLEKSRAPFAESNDTIRFLQSSLGSNSSGGRVLTSQNVIIPNTLAAYDIAQLGGLNPLQPGLSNIWFRRALAEKDLNYTLPVAWSGMVTAPDWPGWEDYVDGRLIYNFMGVRYLVESTRGEISALNIPDLRMVLETPQHRIWEDLRAWPRAFLVQGGVATDLAASDGQAVALAHRRSDRFGAFAVNASAETMAAINALGHQPVITPVRDLEMTSQRVSIKSSSQSAALLVLTDVHYPGWKAWVNGVEQTIWIVNGVVRGIVLPPGDNQVEFRYQPRWLPTTLGLSLAGWLVILLMCAGALRNRRQGE